MNINILDPGLANFTGHHFDLDFKIAKFLHQSGASVSIYSNVAAESQIRVRLSRFGNVYPIFRVGPYVNVNAIDPIAGSNVAFNSHAKILAEDLAAINPGGENIFPTLFASQLQACSMVNTMKRVSGCIHVPASKQYAQDREFWRLAIRASLAKQVDLNIGVIEPELSFEYQKIARHDLMIRHFAIPYEGSVTAHSGRSLKKIGFFGHQRNEKGAANIFKIAQRLSEQGYEILIHDSRPKSQERNADNIRFIPFVDDVSVEIAQCDAIILPYNAEKYKTKGSGILWDSIASGVPVIVPFDTSLARWVTKYQNGTYFFDDDVDSICQAVRMLSKNYSVYFSNAQAARTDWREKNSVKSFVHALIEKN